MGPNTTPVTAESFAKWKQERVEKRERQMNDTRKAKAEAMAKMQQGLKNTGMVFSGRDMFEFNPDWANDGEEGDEEGEDDGMDLVEMMREKRKREDAEGNGEVYGGDSFQDEDLVMTSVGGSVESLQLE